MLEPDDHNCCAEFQLASSIDFDHITVTTVLFPGAELVGPRDKLSTLFGYCVHDPSRDIFSCNVLLMSGYGLVLSVSVALRNFNTAMPPGYEGKIDCTS